MIACLRALRDLDSDQRATASEVVKRGHEYSKSVSTGSIHATLWDLVEGELVSAWLAELTSGGNRRWRWRITRAGRDFLVAAEKGFGRQT